MSEKNEYYESIMDGLNEALEYSKGNLPKAEKHEVIISPIPQYNGKMIKEIRQSLNLTQANFARVLGVSIKTVEAWESGRNHPQGPTSRVLQMLEMNQSLFAEYKILRISKPEPRTARKKKILG